MGKAMGRAKNPPDKIGKGIYHNVSLDGLPEWIGYEAFIYLGIYSTLDSCRESKWRGLFHKVREFVYKGRKFFNRDDLKKVLDGYRNAKEEGKGLCPRELLKARRKKDRKAAKLKDPSIGSTC